MNEDPQTNPPMSTSPALKCRQCVEYEEKLGRLREEIIWRKAARFVETKARLEAEEKVATLQREMEVLHTIVLTGSKEADEACARVFQPPTKVQE
jgi:hypothetical protein